MNINMIKEIWHILGTVDFWVDLIGRFRLLGPFAPILLSFIEAVFPPLPLVAIVTLNVAAYGLIRGFIYSWLGTSLGCTFVFFVVRTLFRRLLIRLSSRFAAIAKARSIAVKINRPTLFMLLILPFTPLSLVNLGFSLSDYSKRRYLPMLYSGLVIRIFTFSVIGKSTASALRQPCFLILSVILLVATYVISKKVTRRTISD